MVLVKTSFLLDSNVIAYWIIHSEILNLATKELGLPEELVTAYRVRYSTSINLVNSIIKTNHNPTFKFYTYEFNFFETNSAIKSEIRSMYLFTKGVPFSKWSDPREFPKIEVSEKFIEEINKRYYKAYRQLTTKKRVNLLVIPFSSDGERFDLQMSIFQDLMYRLPNLRTQDGILVSACLVNRIQYFVTRDKSLKDLNNDLTELLTGTRYKLRIIDPGDSVLTRAS